jgi:hypothetical protein
MQVKAGHLQARTLQVGASVLEPGHNSLYKRGDKIDYQEYALDLGRSRL